MLMILWLSYHLLWGFGNYLNGSTDFNVSDFYNFDDCMSVIDDIIDMMFEGI